MKGLTLNMGIGVIFIAARVVNAAGLTAFFLMKRAADARRVEVKSVARGWCPKRRVSMKRRPDGASYVTPRLIGGDSARRYGRFQEPNWIHKIIWLM